jgi:hypothetical protein
MSRLYGRTADEARAYSTRVMRELADEMSGRAPAVTQPLRPWLGLYRDPRCEEVVRLEYGKTVRIWRRGQRVP